MVAHKLSFCEITLLQGDIAEVVINEGEELNIEKVAEYHEFLIEEMPWTASTGTRRS